MNADQASAVEAVPQPTSESPAGARLAFAPCSGASFPVGLEEGAEGAVIVHSLTVPGCLAGGRDAEAALEAFGRELVAWLGFLESIGESVPPQHAELDIVVDEWIATAPDLAEAAGTALFEADVVPLHPAEIQLVLQRLGDLRGRVLRAIRKCGDPALDRAGPGGWTARQVADELARAQWWTLTRLGASPLAEVPSRTLARLDTAMALIVQQLTTLPPGAEALASESRAVELDGELWTPRKVVRRLLWLEWTLGGTLLEVLSGPESVR